MQAPNDKPQGSLGDLMQEALKNQQATGTSAQPQTQTKTEQSPREEKMSEPEEFGLSRLRNRRMVSGEGGDSFRTKYNQILDYIKEQTDNGDFTVAWDLVPIYAANHALNFDGLAYCGFYTNTKKTNKRVVYAFVLMFEDAGCELQPRPERSKVNGEMIQVPVKPGSQFDQFYRAATRNEIARKLKLEKEDVIVVSGMAIPSYAEMTKPAISQLLLNADNAVVAKANIDSGYRLEAPVNIGLDVEKNEQTFLRFDFNKSQSFQYDNIPVRTDVEVTLSRRTGNSGQTSRDDAMVKTGAMLIAQYNEPNKATQVNAMGQLVAPPTQIYSPLLVLTETQSGRALNGVESLEQRWLSIAAAMYLNRSANWVNMMTPKKGKEELTDIGAFNIDFSVSMKDHPAFAANPLEPVKLNTKAADFGPQQAQQYLSRMFNANLTIGMDILEGGEKAWMDNIFLAAALRPGATYDPSSKEPGDTAVVKANAYILQAMDNVTKNQFSAVLKSGKGHYRMGQAIMIDDGVLYPAGYYKVGGELRDIRDFDLLAFLNVACSNGLQNYELVERWKRAVSPQWGYDNAFRITEMLNLLTKVAPDFTHTGYFSRPLINPAILADFMTAMANAGLAPGMNNYQNQLNDNSYGTSTAYSYALGGDIAYGMSQPAAAPGNAQTSNTWFL